LSIRRRERRLSCNETGATDLCKRGKGWVTEWGGYARH
jgi:hypothetical protein